MGDHEQKSLVDTALKLYKQGQAKKTDKYRKRTGNRIARQRARTGIRKDLQQVVLSRSGSREKEGEVGGRVGDGGKVGEWMVGGRIGTWGRIGSGRKGEE